ncbi:MAG: Glu/Leu/Phe/Val family dehydrogenase [Actinomycetes bacterium]
MSIGLPVPEPPAARPAGTHLESVRYRSARWQVDNLGPASVAFFRLPTGHDAIVVVDNVALGPAIGGLRMSPTVDATEVARLARAMTLKNAAAGLPHGGAKSGIIANPAGDPAVKEQAVRAFAGAIADLTDYIPGPDMGTDETAMAWISDEIGRAVGLPAVLGGIPLDQLGATGFGLAVCAEALQDAGRLRIGGARVAVQGFGAVGRHAALALHECGAVIIAVSDRNGATHNPGGLDLPALVEFRSSGQLYEFPGGQPLPRDELLTLDCDVLVPAAQPDVLDARNASAVRAKVILQGANIPATREAEAIFDQCGILSVPDILANAGGVICASVEYHGGSRDQAFATIREKITANTVEFLDRIRADVLPRLAVEQMAISRVAAAKRYRRGY